MFGNEFYVDPSRCIGCQSCVKACEECETHRGKSMINFDFIERRESITSAAYVCWHCDEPAFPVFVKALTSLKETRRSRMVQGRTRPKEAHVLIDSFVGNAVVIRVPAP